MAGEPTPTTSAPVSPRTGRMISVAVVGGIMLVEGLAIFLLARAVNSGPAPAMAGEESAGKEQTEGAADLVEVELAECRPSNVMSGKFITFHVRVSGLVAAKDLERAQELVEAKQARIQDGVNVVIRSAEPKHLSEPGLETIRRRLKQEFARIFSDESLIRGVLIPYMLQSGAGI